MSKTPEAPPGPGTPLPPGRLFYSRSFAILALVLLFYLLWQVLSPFLAALVWAAIIAYMLEPLRVRLEPRLGGRSSTTAILLLLATFLFLIVPLSLLGAAFAAQAADLVGALQRVAEGEEHTVMARLFESGPGTALVDRLDAAFGIGANEIEAWIAASIERGLNALLSLGGKAFLGIVDTLLSFGVMLFVLFFFVRDGHLMLTRIVALVPFSPARTSRLMAHMGLVMRDVVFGSALTALVQGVLTGAALAMLGIDAPVVLGALAALLALLPVGGPSLVWGPAVIALAIGDRWLAALFLAGWGLLLVATIDNVLRPLLVSRHGRVGTLAVFIGVIGGGAAFGLVGLLIGPVILALAIALARFVTEAPSAAV